MLSENEWNLLKQVLYSSSASKFDTAKEFVKVYDLKPKRLSEFILEELVITYRNYFAMTKNSKIVQTLSTKITKIWFNMLYYKLDYNPGLTLIKTPQIILDPMNDKEFAKLIKIFDNEINLFGMRMLERSRSLLNDGAAKSSDDCSLLTELLIRSHNCFILSCSMEGISNVLETCKLVAIKLEKAGEFNIMVYF